MFDSDNPRINNMNNIHRGELNEIPFPSAHLFSMKTVSARIVCLRLDKVAVCMGTLNLIIT